MPLISLLRIADDSSIVSDMKKILFPAPLLLLCLLVAGCGKQQVKPVSTEGARLIVPVPVTDQDMLALRQVTNFMEPHRKIGVVLGYGYNDEAFVEAALQELGEPWGWRRMVERWCPTAILRILSVGEVHGFPL